MPMARGSLEDMNRALQDLKKFRAKVAETVADPRDVDGEMRHLWTVLKS